ncbi:MAG TPA: ATP-binding cassette domain-containing protein [Solirubrobacterales bacterium]
MPPAPRPAPESAGLSGRGIRKAFGEFVANDDIDIEIGPGRIHALLGENGAGKSTLVSILDGRVAADRGEVTLGGGRLETVGRHGAVATVQQHLALVPSMTGLENIALALGRAADETLRSEIGAVEKRFGIEAPLEVRVAELELPQRQRIALVEALAQEPRILILDEPTTFLPPDEIAIFLTKVRELARSGVGVLLITHHLEEARSVADEVTVLRHGKVIEHHQASELPSSADLVAAMVGEAMVEPRRVGGLRPEVVLEVDGVTVVDRGHRVVDTVDLELRRGEILGLAGVDGNGQAELLDALAGLRRVTAGTINFAARDVTREPLRSRLVAGLQFVSSERRRDGIVPGFTIAEHFSLFPLELPAAGLEDLLRRFDVRPPDPRMVAENLSGGNQQKMVFARAIQTAPAVLILAYPTQGLDVLATSRLHQVLCDRADAGMATILASSDLDELMGVCDRIAVMSRGRIVGALSAAEFDRQRLGSWFSAGDDGADA